MLTKSRSIKPLLLVFAALMFSIGANAQINLSLKNVKVSDAITALNRSQGYSVSVNSGDVDLNKVISVNASGASISDVLDQIFAGQQVIYIIDGKSISVSKGKPKVEPSPLTGVVEDENGEALMGAGILIKGTTQGFISGPDGSFTLTNVKYPATLVVSYIGYADQEIPVNGNEGHIKVVFSDAKNLLEDRRRIRHRRSHPEPAPRDQYGHGPSGSGPFHHPDEWERFHRSFRIQHVRPRKGIPQLRQSAGPGGWRGGQPDAGKPE